MITKREAKLIKSLQLKKFRLQEGTFVVEGEKNVFELLNSSIEILKIFGSEKFIDKHQELLDSKDTNLETAKASEISTVSFLKTNTTALALAKIPKSSKFEFNKDYILAFENLQDPGNLGTIVRTADWYGFKDIICSTDSVDCFNPKVIAATMGSFARVNVHYLELDEFIKRQNLPVYGALLSGTNIHHVSFQEKGILLFGNESKGISDKLNRHITEKVLIPAFGQAESLNVSIATAVFCDNLRRTQNT
jgi:TrmH family RNA methyltransferase